MKRRRSVFAACAVLIAIACTSLPASADDLPRPGELVRHQQWVHAERFARDAADYAAAITPPTRCPLPGAELVDTWGAPRSGGRTHEGTDIMAPEGTPVLAPESGSIEYRTTGLGGLSFFLTTPERVWYGTHLSGYEGSAREVTAGDVIAYVGMTGNAPVPHLHLAYDVGGVTTNAYQWLVEACSGRPAPVTESARAVPEPVWPYNVLEIERWYEARTHTRISGVTARALTRYLNAVVRAQLVRYLAAVQGSDLVWHWQLVAECESGDNVNAVNPSGTYRGWLQFDVGSWQANGGSGDPLGQPREVAARVAENYRLRVGSTSPWPQCGVHYRP